LCGDGTSEEVAVIGIACSEAFSGQRLAKILQPGFQLQSEAMVKLAAGECAPTLSIHTSGGLPPALDRFLEALEPHLPWAPKSSGEGASAGAAEGERDDWLVSLQVEGASAVMAAVDLLLQLQHAGGGSAAAGDRLKVAVGANSYHGPGSTSLGAAEPLGPGMKPNQIKYPVPSIFNKRGGEADADFNARVLADFDSFLDAHAHELGVLLIEPQWGSSVAAMPWDRSMLREWVVFFL
jgi:hypothetical protein